MPSAGSTTGCNQCSSRLELAENGIRMNPPTIDSAASTTSGSSIIHGDSCGFTSWP